MITPQEEYPELANALELKVPLYFKREDLHPLASHKGRSIPVMIDHYVSKGHTKFAISGSGNASLAAALHIQKNEALSLSIYVGNNINPKKLQRLQDLASDYITIEQVERPKQTVFTLDKDSKAKALRQSTDDVALLGYKELADELIAACPELNRGAIFVPTSSGTTAQALGEAFPHTELHIAQTTKVYPIAFCFDSATYFDKSDSSLADAIVDRVAHRGNRVNELIFKSEGCGWAISDAQIKEAQQLVRKHCGGLELSPNGVLGVAALKKARDEGWTFNGAVVCLITGH